MTYKKIQDEVKAKHGFAPKTCWIAHIKSDNGLTTRKSPNRISSTKRKYPCPPEKRPQIEKVMKRLGYDI
ncbi:MAG: hypothetical protein HAW64_06240 [Alphaproteobacteria bacterium]|nr:hypothetical protein [Alphaproteobacteria bacterium]